MTVPKAELHNHLEGTAPPALIATLAARNGVTLPAGLIGDGAFGWTGFSGFLQAYDRASTAIRRAQDYRDVTRAYLEACAGEGALYVELAASPDHAAANGLDYCGMVAGIAEGILAARAATGIEARIIITAVRHHGEDRVVAVARLAASNPHPLVTGFGLAGDEAHVPASRMAKAFHIATADAGLGATVHAGEAAGADSVADALTLPITRIGHGVRAIEDAGVTARLIEKGIVLEVCPTSNVATGVYRTLNDHPLPRLLKAGIRITLNSDDPPYFRTSIGHEYSVAASMWGLADDTLTTITRAALEAAFVDEETRGRLLAQLPRSDVD